MLNYANERGNTWLMGEDGKHYILIGQDINQDNSAKSSFLEICITPQNYPGFEVSLITEHSTNDMVKHIKERFADWNVRKWNLPVEAPIDEMSCIIGIEWGIIK